MLNQRQCVSLERIYEYGYQGIKVEMTLYHHSMSHFLCPIPLDSAALEFLVLKKEFILATTEMTIGEVKATTVPRSNAGIIAFVNFDQQGRETALTQ